MGTRGTCWRFRLSTFTELQCCSSSACMSRKPPAQLLGHKNIGFFAWCLCFSLQRSAGIIWKIVSSCRFWLKLPKKRVTMAIYNQHQIISTIGWLVVVTRPSLTQPGLVAACIELRIWPLGSNWASRKMENMLQQGASSQEKVNDWYSKWCLALWLSIL